MKRLILIILLLMPFSWEINAYLPIRAQEYQRQLKTGFEKRKKAIMEKLASTREHETELTKTAIPRRISRFSNETLLNASNAVTKALEAEIEHLNQQIKLTSEPTLAIKSKIEEDGFIKKLQATLNIKDLETRIHQLARTDAFLQEQKRNKGEEEIRALDQLRSKLADQRRILHDKLIGQQRLGILG